MKAVRGSQMWLQVAVYEKSDLLNRAIHESVALPPSAFTTRTRDDRHSVAQPASTR
jgi:hypothetical protein